jgi:hypothetical protein
MHYAEIFSVTCARDEAHCSFVLKKLPASLISIMQED